LGALGDGRNTGGTDLDTCRDPNTGDLAPFATGVLARVQTYSEMSPSQTRAKAFFLYNDADKDAMTRGFGGSSGKQYKKANGSDHPPSIECYLDRRFFTFTQEELIEYPSELRTVGLEDVRWIAEVAGPALVGNEPGGNGPRHSDNTRSAKAFRKG